MSHPKSNAEQRAIFKEKIKKYEEENRSIVYLDESGFALDAPRLRGYSTQGKRCYDVVNYNAKGRINAIGAIVKFSFLNVTLFENSIDSEVFYLWLKESLLPEIDSNSVIVMDNASFHKNKSISLAIKDKGCILEYLPAYSPDLNPIERKWAQVKKIRRRTRCSPYELFEKYNNNLF